MLHHSHIPNQPFRSFLGLIPHLRTEPKTSRLGLGYPRTLTSDKIRFVSDISNEQKSRPYNLKVGRFWL